MFKRKIIRALPGAVLALGLAGAPLAAQFTPSAAAGVSWEMYEFGTAEAANIQRISLLTTPISGLLPIGTNASVQLRGNFAYGQLVRADGSDATLVGPTDTEVRLGYTFGHPQRPTATVALIGLLPTGNSSHTLEEAEVAGAVAAELLPFRITHWGTGGGIGASAGATSQVGQGNVGISASYLVAREFEPVDVQGAAPFVYRPGNQLQVRGAFDQNVGPNGRLTVTATFQHHSEDEQGGSNLYRPGVRYHAMGSYAFTVGAQSTALLYVGGLHRNRGTALAERVIAAPAQDLLLAGAGLRLPVGPGVVAPSLDARLHRSEDGVGQGYLIGLGSSLEWPAGGAVLIPNVRLRAGNLTVRENLESGLLGLEVGLTARYRP